MMKAFGLVFWDINEMLMVLLWLVFCQILVNSANQSLLYESVPVSEGSPVLRDTLFSPDLQFIYTLTDRQVSTLAFTTLKIMIFNTVLQLMGKCV